MDKRYYVYFYRRKDTNDVCYIGKGTGKRLRKFSQHNEHCQNIYKKYGLDTEIVADNLTSEEACKMEIDLISHYVNDLGYGIEIQGYARNELGHNLCNRTFGGEGQLGFSPSEETREKIRQSKLGDKNPAKRPDVRKKLSENHYMKNPEAAKTHSERLKQFYKTKEGQHRLEKMAKRNKERLLKDNPMKNPEISKQFKGGGNPSAVHVMCVETEEIFGCLKDLEPVFGIGSSTIGYHLNKSPNGIVERNSLHYIKIPSKK